MAYATTAQLASFMGVAEGTLPADASRLLQRASEVVDGMVRAPYDVDAGGLPTDPDIAAVFRDATCAQAEAWVNQGGDSGSGSGTIRSFSTGSRSVTYADPASAGTSPEGLNGRAALLLRRAGLLTGRVAV